MIIQWVVVKEKVLEVVILVLLGVYLLKGTKQENGRLLIKI